MTRQQLHLACLKLAAAAMLVFVPLYAAGTQAAADDWEGQYTLFRCDFEGGSQGPLPDGNPNDHFYWTSVVYSAESTLTVVPGNGGQMLKYERVATATGEGGPRVVKWLDVNPESKVRIDFKIRTHGHRFFLELRNTGGSPATTPLLYLRGDGLSPYLPEGATLDPDQFVDASVLIDFANRTYSSWLNGIPVQSGMALNAGIDLSRRVEFRFAAALYPGEVVHMDDVAITADAFPDADGRSVVAKLRPEHPRLLVSAGDFAALRTRIASDPLIGSWYEQIVEHADEILGQPVSEYGFPDGRSLLQVTRQVLNRAYTLAFVYQISGDERYAERLWEELEASAAFPDWNPTSFLSTAEMTHAFAIGYDWMYHYWSPERRQILVDAIVELGLTPGIEGYRSGAWWTTTSSNWNIVTNGGLGIGALAVGSEAPYLADEILRGGLGFLPRAIEAYAPDGGYPEGVVYWEYATQYLTPYLASLESATGDDFGLADFPGLSETGLYPIYMAGPTGHSFHYYDASASAARPNAMFWMANRYGNPVYNWWGLAGTNISPRSLLWYDPQDIKSPREAGLPLDKYFRKSEVVTMRSAWENPQAVYAGVKAGFNQTSHGDLDLGTFVLDALGTRWALELGSEHYSLPGYWDMGPSGRRWTYYRKRAEGQNTLAVNPGSGPDQDPLAAGEIIRFETGPAEAFAIAELTEAFANQGVSRWQRGVALVDHRRQVIVRDELEADEPVDVWWFMHTNAEIEVSDDGRSAILTQGDKRLLARMATNAEDAAFSVLEAEPLWFSPDPDQTPNGSVRKLAIELNDVENLQLSVLFTPLRSHQEPDADLPEMKPLAEWSVEQTELPLLSELSVNGEPLEGFAPDVFTYDLIAEPGETAPPLVTASAADPGSEVVVTQAATLPGTAEIRVIRPGAPEVAYEIHFGQPADMEPVTASIVGTFPPSHTIDNKLDTFFSANGKGQWVQYNLGRTRTLHGVSLAWYQGNVRAFAFEVLASEDGETWIPVYRGTSAGDTLELEDHLFDPVQARFVRIVGYGNTVNDWMSITEARILHEDGVWPVFEDEEQQPILEEVTANLSSESVAIGETATLNLAGTMSDGSEADFSEMEVRYESSDESVAAVLEDGTIEALSEGTARLAVIVLTPDRWLKYDTVTIQVKDPAKLLLYPVADAHVHDGANADRNFGSSPIMQIKKDPTPGYSREAYLQFDLSSMEGGIESATLYLYASTRLEHIHGVDIHVAGGDWKEDTLTWNTKPEIGEKIGSIQVDAAASWRSIDITPYVLEHAGAGERLSLALLHVPPAPGPMPTVDVRSRETGSAGPYLEIKRKVNASLDPAGPDGQDGWYVSPVNLTLQPAEAAQYQITVTESVYHSTPPTDGMVPYSGPVTFTDGIYEVRYGIIGRAGEAGLLRLKVDTTAPEVSLNAEGAREAEGSPPSYALDQEARITCAAEDALSGIAQEPCGSPLLETSAYLLEPGEHTVTADVYDLAGNHRRAALAFTVTATFDSLADLTGRLVSETGKPGAGGIALALKQKLSDAEDAAGQGDMAAMREALQDYVNQVNDLSGNKLTEEQASVLARWAQWLQENGRGGTGTDG